MKYTVAIVMCGVLVASLAWAEPEWRASVGIGEEYNDNTNEKRHGKGDFVTTLEPAVGYRHEGVRTLLEGEYRGTWNHYADNTRDQEFNHDARAHALFEAWRNFLYFDLSDTYQLVNLDTTRGEVVEDDSSLDQVQRNTFSFSTFITPRLGERGQLKTGYAYNNIWYEKRGESKNIHAGFADLTYELSDRMELLSGYGYTLQLAGSGDLDRHVAYLGLGFQFAANSVVFVKAGPRFTHYHESGASSTKLFWDAGWTHDFGRLLLEARSGLDAEDDPDSGDTYDKRYGTIRLTKEFDRSSVGVFATLEDYDQEDSDSIRRTYAGLTLGHDLTPRLKGVASIARDLRTEDSDDRVRWYGSVVFRYALAEDLAAEAWYRHKDVLNSEDDDDDYAVHRIGVRLTKQF